MPRIRKTQERNQMAEQKISAADILAEVGKIKRFVVTAVEYGDSVDGKGSVVGVFSTKEYAKIYMDGDAQSYYSEGGFDKIELYADSASVGSTDECGCEWKIQEIEIPVYKNELDSLNKECK